MRGAIRWIETRVLPHGWPDVMRQLRLFIISHFLGMHVEAGPEKALPARARPDAWAFRPATA